MKLFAVTLSALVVLCACEDNTSYRGPVAPGLQNPASASVDFVPGYVTTDNQIYTPDLSDSMRNYYEPYFRQAARVKAEFAEFITNSDTAWSWVHSNVQNELDDWDTHYFYYSIAPYVANRMLWFQLLGNTPYSTTKKEAIQFYVNLALEYNSPDAEMMADALIILHENDFWSTTRVKSAADSASGFVDDWLLVFDPDICECEDSTGSTSTYIMNALDAQEDKYNLIIASQNVLDSLAAL